MVTWSSPDVRLKCVRCNSTPLETLDDSYACRQCAARFPIVRGIPRFVAEEAYSGSFGFQWNRFARTQLDSANQSTRSRDMFCEKTGWDVERLRGARVLDAGCGMGRFSEVCADAGAEVHAIDLSSAVEAAAANLAHRSNVKIYQADIFRLPFADQSFDFIYSIGVLHHTPDTRAAFSRLVELLKPGGSIAIWVYSARLRLLLGSQLLRPVTSRLPKTTLMSLTRVAKPLYYLHSVPLVGQVTSVLLPTSMDPDPEWRWLDTFDWYSPRFQWKHGFAEVEQWFREAGLDSIRRLGFPVAITAKRPAS
jgi:SAM-dependent methyltransferase